MNVLPIRTALLAVLLPLTATLTAQRPAAAAAAYERLVEHAYQVFEPVGLAVAIVADDAVVAEIAHGVCEVGSDDPITPQSIFNIASCTKAFTAACVAKLVEAGKVGWDDRVIDHLPGFRLADPWITRQMTVRDLLSHRSGLETFEGDLLWYGSERSDAEVFASLEKLPIDNRFRDQYGYQNLMFLCAGLLVEKHTGQPWTQYVHSTFFEPLGMDGSAPSFAGLPDGAPVAMPHIDHERTKLVTFNAGKPAASIWASVHDMVPWVRMLLAGGEFEGRRLLSEASLRSLWRPHISLGRGGRTPYAMEDFGSYGLGWFLYAEGGKKVVEHDGGMPGYISKVTLVPEDRFGFVILNNDMDGILNFALRRAIFAQRAGQDGRQLLDRFAQFAKRRRDREFAELQEREGKRRKGTKPSRPLGDYAGRFADEVLGTAILELRGEALHLTVERSPATLVGELEHWHDDTFRVDFPDRFLPFALLRFERGYDGSIGGFTIECPIADFDFAALRFVREAD